MKNGYSISFIIGFGLLIISTPIHASDVICINEADKSYNVLSKAHYFEDISGVMSFIDVHTEYQIGNFKKVDGSRSNFGNTTSAFWITFQVAADSHLVENSNRSSFKVRVGYPHFNYIDLYRINAAGELLVTQSGLKRNPDIGSQFEDFLLPTGDISSNPTRYFLRLQSEAAMILDISLVDKTFYLSQNAMRRLFLGLYYGIIIAMVLYNLFLFLSIREVVYLIYILYVFSYGLYQFGFDGFGKIFLFPGNQEYGLKFGILMGAVFLIFANLFTNTFLQLKKHSVVLHFITLISAGLSAVLAISFFVIDFRIFNNISNLLAILQLSPTMLAAGILMMNRGFRPAKFFTLASGFFVGGLIVRVVKNIGFFEDTFITNYAMHMGSAAELSLLSLALGDRINILKNQYRGMAQKLLGVQDEERERIARDLHDSLGQYLTTAKLQNSLTKISLSGEDESTHGNVSEVDQLLGESIDECHRIAYELSPPSIQKFGLITAVKDLTDSYEKRMGVHIELDESLNGQRLPEEKEIALFRILQEALNNIQKYAEATTVVIKLRHDENQIKLMIRDNGKGFELDQNQLDTLSASRKGLGLLSMAERTNNHHGTFDIASKPGQGTKVTVKLPLKNTQQP